MSFTIQLYKNKSEKEKLDKTIELLATYTGDLKSETSIINPSILIECNIDDVALANYAYIPVFGRYYYITDITSVRTKIVQFNMHSDVLSSFKTQIRSNEAVIKRQEESYNLYIEDKQMKYYQKPLVTVKEFPNGFSGFSPVLSLSGAAGIGGLESLWYINSYENGIQSNYTTVAGGIIFRWVSNDIWPANIRWYVVGTKYSEPEWTQNGSYIVETDNDGYIISERYLGEGYKSFFTKKCNSIIAWRTNTGYDGFNQEALCIYANSDPNYPEMQVKYNLLNNTSAATAQRIELPHNIKYITIEWAEAGATP